MELKDFLEKYKVLIIILLIVGLIGFSQGGGITELSQVQGENYIEIPCDSKVGCEDMFSKKFTESQIEDLDIYCENDRCYMKGGVEKI